MKFESAKQKIEPIIKDYISNVFSALEKTIAVDMINITFQNKGEHPPKFEEGKMYIYSFWLEGEDAPLKIGKAGPKSKARYTSHHYNQNSSGSCLAKRIAEDNEFITKYDIKIDELKNWIINNCYRINIEMPYDTENGYDLYTLELVEAIMHNIYPPKYEGTTEQQRKMIIDKV